MADNSVEKVCTRCKILKPLDEFGAQKRKLDGKEAQCKECIREYRRTRWRKTYTPDKHRAMHLWIRYKMRPEEYDAMLQSQNGTCAICHKPPKGKERHLRVDHCHDTGVIRGLLCATCNIGIGNLGDSIEGLEKALAYLRQTKEQLPPQPSQILKTQIKGESHHWYGKPSMTPRGTNSPRSILTEERVRKILKDWATGNVTQSQLGKEHGVSTATIQKITQRQSWKHVK